MKRDGRTLTPTTLEEFRLLALRRMRERRELSEVIKSLGKNRTSIYRWLKAAAARRGKGERALASRRAIRLRHPAFLLIAPQHMEDAVEVLFLDDVGRADHQAQALRKSQTALGAHHRWLCSRMNKLKAITASAW